jgi:hypothetical protein
MSDFCWVWELGLVFPTLAINTEEIDSTVDSPGSVFTDEQAAGADRAARGDRSRSVTEFER